jgi:hypothetical protein
MLEAFASILICGIIAAGCYYSAHYIVQLRHNRDTIADELTRAEAHIRELEDRVMLLEADRDVRDAKLSGMRTGDASGWDMLNARG